MPLTTIIPSLKSIKKYCVNHRIPIREEGEFISVGLIPFNLQQSPVIAMTIFFHSHLRFCSADLIQANLLKSITKQQALVALVALTILSGLGYCLTRFYYRSRNNLKTKCQEDSSEQKAEKNEVAIWNSEENHILDNSKQEFIIQHKVSLPVDSIYDLYSDDLRDKKWKEEGEAAYLREMAVIKALRKKLQIFRGQYDELLKQYPRYYHLIQKELNTSCVPRSFRRSYQEKFQAVIYEALKVREVYQKTHYAFLHGRALSWRTFSYFTKKLVQAFRPALKVDGIDFLRAPFRKHVFQNAHEFLKCRASETIDDHQTFLRTQLIAVDAFWLNYFPAESALYFFGTNASASLPRSDTYYPLLNSCFHSHLPNRESLIQSIIEKMQDIGLTLQDELWTAQGVIPGELIVICIPKAMIKNPELNPIYRSQARGIPASNPEKAIGDLELLERLQHDESIPDIELNEVQYRVLASQLTPKNGVRIFGINALSKELKKIYKEPIQKLVKEIFATATQQDVQGQV